MWTKYNERIHGRQNVSKENILTFSMAVRSKWVRRLILMDLFFKKVYHTDIISSPPQI